MAQLGENKQTKKHMKEADCVMKEERPSEKAFYSLVNISNIKLRHKEMPYQI
jgi:hypothetical protein